MCALYTSGVCKANESAGLYRTRVIANIIKFAALSALFYVQDII